VIPLDQVAKLKRVVGPGKIASENGRLRVFVQANVHGRDLGSSVQESSPREWQRIASVHRV
jgi:copper/silver efflux system protein